MRFINRTGMQDGRLTFQRFVGKNKFKQSLWEAKCECGTVVKLQPGTALSCGCLLAERIREPKPCTEEHRQRISEAKSRKDTEHDCAECGVHFIGTKLQKHCSDKCARAFRSQFEGRRERHWTRKTGAPYEAVDFWKVYERDGGICQICMLAAPPELRGNKQAADAPTLDHIVPLSKGGGHIYSNVRLAHYDCNNEKSDTLLVGAVIAYVNPDPRTRIDKIREETKKAMAAMSPEAKESMRRSMSVGQTGRIHSQASRDKRAATFRANRLRHSPRVRAPLPVTFP